MTHNGGSSELPRLRRVPKFSLDYHDSQHKNWPHVVKFSGGRSSALMLLGLLYGKQLKRSRGDVIVFNNTSAEHPATYRFATLCKRIAEQRFNIPFIWTEFQSFEDARRGKWTRLPSYRMVEPEIFSENCPDGYKCHGEVFEELVSWKQALPTRFARTCTEYLKLNTTFKFLEDWFGRSTLNAKTQTDSTPRLGHWFGEPWLNSSTFGKRSSTVRYHLSCPVHRPTQSFQKFTQAKLSRINNPNIAKKCFDSKAQLNGPDPVEYISLVGLRADEPRRVSNILERNSETDGKKRIASGEYVYAPLFDSGFTKLDVLDFWSTQVFDLETPPQVNLSNCVFCFMKGERTLREIATISESEEQNAQSSPSSISWWADFENRYAREVTSSKDPNARTRFGFFGANRLEYQNIIDTLEEPIQKKPSYTLPCDCTD